MATKKTAKTAKKTVKATSPQKAPVKKTAAKNQDKIAIMQSSLAEMKQIIKNAPQAMLTIEDKIVAELSKKLDKATSQVAKLKTTIKRNKEMLAKAKKQLSNKKTAANQSKVEKRTVKDLTHGRLGGKSRHGIDGHVHRVRSRMSAG